MGDRGKAHTSQPMAKLLSKVDLAFSLYGIIVTGVIIIFLSQSPQTIHEYVEKNPDQEDFVHFLEFDEQKQWTILAIYFGWYVLEVGLAILFIIGSDKKSFEILRVWLILTVLNCMAGLASAVPAYMFTAYKMVFVIFALVIYVYKLFEIYIVDTFIREICKAPVR
jgi:hypothetical protein